MFYLRNGENIKFVSKEELIVFLETGKNKTFKFGICKYPIEFSVENNIYPCFKREQSKMFNSCDGIDKIVDQLLNYKQNSCSAYGKEVLSVLEMLNEVSEGMYYLVDNNISENKFSIQILYDFMKQKIQDKVFSDSEFVDFKLAVKSNPLCRFWNLETEKLVYGLLKNYQENSSKPFKREEDRSWYSHCEIVLIEETYDAQFSFSKDLSQKNLATIKDDVREALSLAGYKS